MGFSQSSVLLFERIYWGVFALFENVRHVVVKKRLVFETIGSELFDRCEGKVGNMIHNNDHLALRVGVVSRR